MANVKPRERHVSAFRLMITLTPAVAKRVRAIAKEENRSAAATLRLLVEKGIASIDAK